MATKHRATKYDIRADSATRPDIVSAQTDWDDDWRRSSLAEQPPRWNEPTIPDLPLRVSMAAPPAERAPTHTSVPRSGTRNRAVTMPPPAPSLAELAAEQQLSSPSAAPAAEDARAVFFPEPRPRSSTLAPLAVAVMGIAA